MCVSFGGEGRNTKKSKTDRVRHGGVEKRGGSPHRKKWKILFFLARAKKGESEIRSFLEMQNSVLNLHVQKAHSKSSFRHGLSASSSVVCRESSNVSLCA